ncbi:hypothetical protein QFC22_006096 [Naganishia vaughanmartiniae]|uniref:Uncharacterized protein n=1 Tax=Naganishia vaughanmartiniae TaxID=1424756 RepID=A0ACC2WNU6_9TREE|nr:hypothetical protein QFC22_006096 [Naganishia vaughanmartiniae]
MVAATKAPLRRANTRSGTTQSTVNCSTTATATPLAGTTGGPKGKTRTAVQLDASQPLTPLTGAIEDRNAIQVTARVPLLPRRSAQGSASQLVVPTTSIARPTAVPTSSRQASQRVITAAQRENLVSPSSALPRSTVREAPLNEVPPASPLLERMDITIRSVLNTQDDSTQGDNSPVVASTQPAPVLLIQTEPEK